MNETIVVDEFPQEWMDIITEVKGYSNFLKLLKSEILEKDEYQEVKDRQGEIVNFFLKKSGYYKLKRAFKVKIELIDWKPYVNDKGTLKWCYFHVKGTLPDGESMDAFGACSSAESGKRSPNDVIGTAHTRANLRAISQLVDHGSVSSDEIAVFDKPQEKRPRKRIKKESE